MVLGRFRRLNAGGYTMAELLIAIAVTGILAALGYPYVTSYLQAAQTRAGAEQLATILNGGRQLAITRNTNVCVSVVSSKATYTTGVSNACAGGTTFVGVSTGSDGTIPLDNSIQITGATAPVVFSSLGAAVQAGTYTVRNPSTGETMTVVVSAAGRVAIQ